MPWTLQNLSTEQREALIHSLDVLEGNTEYLRTLSQHSGLSTDEVRERFETYRWWLKESPVWLSPSQHPDHGGLDMRLKPQENME